MNFPYQRKIEKKEIGLLPRYSYDQKVTLIDSDRKLNGLKLNLKKGEVIGFDTETKPSFKKGLINECSLVQLALPGEVLLFRLNKVGYPSILSDLFMNDRILKVGIAIHDDIKGLQKFESFEAKNFTDLNVVCPEIGFESIGAKKLTAIVLGYQISKRQQVSNWEAKALSEAQVKYAATDAWICREIFLKLKSDGLISRA